MNVTTPPVPQILAPAGNKAGFLAALSAGADAVYCGLKQLSARMEAKNFAMTELAALTELAHGQGARVYVTMNTLIRPEELDTAGRLLDGLNRHVHPDAVIVQDPAMVALARQTGFSGEIHLSTLANVSFGRALQLIRRIPGVRRVVLPRELSIDEIKQVAALCPEGIGLEVFVHGALCYGISGRCYWSSFLGGKSGLRGRCVQPCRRVYTQEHTKNRFFSCQDLSLDVLVKILRPIPEIRAWKIEGRKKSPHYVYYTVRAYQLLRDHVQDAHLRKEALDLLSRALGRSGTHYRFLSQRPAHPIQIDRQTGSGLCVGHVAAGGGGRIYFTPDRELFPDDVLRIGYEDEPWHFSFKIGRPVSSGDRFSLKPSGKTPPRKGAPVFLTDRREPELAEKIAELERQMPPVRSDLPPSRFQVALPRPRPVRLQDAEQTVFRDPRNLSETRTETGIWLSTESVAAVSRMPEISKDLWWWMTPALWPEDEAAMETLIGELLEKGCRRFVLNAPCQITFFKHPRKLSLWAGPFCNIASPLAVQEIESYGFSGAVVSPELCRMDYLALPGPSPLPLGIVLSGHWPFCISRILSDRLKPDAPFQSPKGERAWASRRDHNYWVYPDWKLDWRAYRPELVRAGYQKFIHLSETVPPSIGIKDRPGNWNWKIPLP